MSSFSILLVVSRTMGTKHPHLLSHLLGACEDGSETNFEALS